MQNLLNNGAPRDAATFLQNLFAPYEGTDLRLEIRCLWPSHVLPRHVWNDGTPRETLSDWWPLTLTGIEAAAKTAVHWQRDWNVYVGILPRAGRKRFAVDVPSAAWLWSEIDGKTEGQAGALELLKTAVNAGLPAPGLLVGSGGGVHSYWPLAEPIPLPDLESRKTFIQTLQRLAVAVGGVKWDADNWGRPTGKLRVYAPSLPFADPTCCDIARILRVPGTWNHKLERNAPVSLLTTNAAPILSYKHWRATLPALPYAPPRQAQQERRPGEVLPLPAKTLQDMQTRWPEGQKYKALRRILHTARLCGWTQYALEILADTFVGNHQCDPRPAQKLVRDTMQRIVPDA